MPASRRIGLAAAALLAPALFVPTLVTASPSRAATAYTSQTLHFRVTVGPDRSQVCDIVGLLFTPSSATASTPAPAILTTNGFGGSDQD